MESGETRMLAALTKALQSYIHDANRSEAFDGLLGILLEVTESEYGFIGEVCHQEDGQPFLRTQAITNIAWNDETRAFYDEHAADGLEFFNLKSLFGHVLTSGKAVITNEPAQDPRGCGVPSEHPPLRAFLGLPFSFRDEMVGMVGVANRDGGYDEEVLARLEPLLTTCAQLIHAGRIERERREADEREARMMAVLEQSYRLESLGRLAGCVAHDFNNLLTVIRGNCELLLGDLDPDCEMTEDVHMIAHAAERGADLTRQLLAFARQDQVGSGHADFAAVIMSGVQLLERLVGARIKLVAEQAESLGQVGMDASQLEQVLVNLGVNARDAMPDGGTLRIESSSITFRGEPGVRLRVSDSGTGISRDVQDRMFDPFFTTKSMGSGTGLGLAMCYGAVTKAGGDIRVDSELGQGATFTVELPVRDVVEGGMAEEPDAQLAQGGGEHVLLVEDEAGILSMAARSLRLAGYEVKTAANGYIAENMVREGGTRFDLLITDVVMPGLRGNDLVKRVSDSVPHVLFMSGYLGLDEAARLDISDYPMLAKPFTQKELLEKVASVLATASV